MKGKNENSIIVEQLVNAIPGGVAVYKMGKKIETLYFSEGVPKLSGRTMEEYKAWISEDIFQNTVYKDDIPEMMSNVKTAVSNGTPLNITYRLRHKDGNLIWIQLSAAKIREEDGCPIYYAVYTKQAEETALYKSIVEDSGAAIYIAQKGTRKILYANKMFKEFIGIPTSLVITGERLSDLIPKEHLLLKDAEIEALRQEKYVEFRRLGKTGKYFHISARGLNWNGLNAYVCYLTDETEIMRSQQELIGNRKMLDLSLKTAKVMVWKYDPYHYRITDSGSLGEAYGLPKVIENVPEYFIEREYIDENYVESFREIFEKMPSKEQLFFDIRGKSADGSKYLWQRLYYTPILDENGNVIEEVGNSIDITEQHHIEQRYEYELQMKNELLNDALIYYQVNVTQYTIEEKRFLTPEVEKYTEPVKFTREIWLEAVYKFLREDYQQACLDTLDMDKLLKEFHNGITSVKIPFFKLKEEVLDKWCTVDVSLMKRPETDDIIAMIYVRNIDAEHKKQMTLDSIIDEETEIISLLEVATGKTKVIKISRDCFLLPKEEIYDFDEFGVECITKNATTEDKNICLDFFNVKKLMKKLEFTPIPTIVFSCRQSDGKIHRKKTRAFYLDESKKDIVIVRRDVTDMYEEEQKRAEELKRALHQAMEANKAKSAFLSRVSHDMRTPLNGILGLTHLMREKKDWSEIQNDLNQLELSGDYLLNLINDTLDVSRIENNKLELHPVVCDGREVFVNTLNLLKPNLEAKNIQFHIHADRLPYTILYLDVGRVEQLIMNIVSNSIKFTSNGGDIHFYIENITENEEEIVDRVRIKDNGIGMSPEFLPHLFEPFSQEDTNKTSKYQGTGLGMTISKQIVELMGGTISATSTLGEGTEFTFEIHMKKATEEQIANWHMESKPEADICILKGKRILLCEDHPLNIQIAIRLLKKKGMTIDVAGNGKRGVELFALSKEFYYDAILMDIRMPVLDGLDATRQIRNLDRADAAKIPIIAMTANALSHDIEETKNAGMNAHLSKPVEPQLFYETLADCITEVKNNVNLKNKLVL